MRCWRIRLQKRVVVLLPIRRRKCLRPLHFERSFSRIDEGGTSPILIHRSEMRQLAVAAVLFTVLSLWGAPIIVALTLGSPGDHLPACCRRNGKHHCMMQTMLELVLRPAFTAPRQYCPLYPKTVLPVPARLNLFVPKSGAAFFAALQSQPAVAMQTEAKRRVAFDRNRLKRGPPAFL